jgi:hypothetical protein
LRLAAREGVTSGDAAAYHEALVADLARRCGDFEAAILAAARGLAAEPEEGIGDVLEFERRLARTGDSAVHTIEEALHLGGAAAAGDRPSGLLVGRAG